ncbi:MAG: O-antigen ligase family protein [Terracidiphilus sp.]
MTPTLDRASSYVEGSAVDAAVYEALEIVALILVISRWHRVIPVLRKNWAICLFFLYAAMSISWSDFPFVTLKHWIKGVGDVMMVMIILTEPSVPEAIKRVFTRLAFVLVPISVLFIKYYATLGRRLTLSWTMEPIGVATQKNGLGELCDFFGLVLLWRFRTIYNDPETPNRRNRLIALSVVLVMIVWLLWMCNSMTSICALSMATTVMFLSTRPAFRRKPALVHFLFSGLLLCALYALFFQSSGTLIESLGRNPTLTGRTDIWQMVITVPTNRLVGSGYESFWLGDRLQKMWQAFPGLKLNESHNGYVEILITLGWIGLVCLGVLIASGYRNVIRTFRRDPDFGSLKLAFFLACIVTGLTEAAFRVMGPPWIVFLLAIIATPVYATRKIGQWNLPDSQPPAVDQEAHVIREETRRQLTRT